MFHCLSARRKTLELVEVNLVTKCNAALFSAVVLMVAKMIFLLI